MIPLRTTRGSSAYHTLRNADVENYLQMFEAIATREDWPQGEWARVLAPLLTGEAQRAYFTLSPEQRESYEEL